MQVSAGTEQTEHQARTGRPDRGRSGQTSQQDIARRWQLGCHELLALVHCFLRLLLVTLTDTQTLHNERDIDCSITRRFGRVLMNAFFPVDGRERNRRVFLVRNGGVEIGVDDCGVPYLENHEGRGEETTPAQMQSIIGITLAQWMELVLLATEFSHSRFKFRVPGSYHICWVSTYIANQKRPRQLSCWTDPSHASMSRGEDASQIFAGLCICTTGLPVHVKEQIRKVVLACDGAFEDDLTLDATTHLVADAVGSHKHRAAVNKKLPVVSSRWIFDSFRARELLDTSRYALRVLEGLVVCTTGLSAQTRGQVETLAAIHGGVYDPSLEVGRTNALIAQAPIGEKYEAATAHGIPVVHISWMHACIEKGELVDEASYSLENVLKPRRIYKQLKHELDDLSGTQLRHLLRRYWKRQHTNDDAMDVDEEGPEEPEDFMELLDACGFYLLGFPPEMEKALQTLIRTAMGTIYYEMQVPSVSHVIVSPVLRDMAELERLEQEVVLQNAEAITHFVSAKWLVDSLKCLRLEPEEMYPVEIEEPFDEFAIAAAPPALDKRLSILSTASATGDDNELNVSMDNADNDKEDAASAQLQGKIFKDYGFLLVCLDPNEPRLVRSTVKELQKRGGAQAVALDYRDFELVDPAQFDFVTHVVVGSGVSLDPELAEIVRQKFYGESGASSGKKRRLRFVSDLWVRCCLAADCLWPHQSHELFSLTYRQPRSMFPVALPVSSFKSVVASTSVYVGVDRVVIMELLRMAGAQATNKLSKKNTHLICLNPIGMKYEKAKEWQLKIVTARWVVQSVLHGALLDTSLPEFQVVDDDTSAADGASSTTSGSRTTLGSLEPPKQPASSFPQE